MKKYQLKLIYAKQVFFILLNSVVHLVLFHRYIIVTCLSNYDNLKNILDLSYLVCGYIWAMPRTLLFCDLDLQFQGHWWPHKGQILAIFSHFGPVLIYRKLDHPMAGIYNNIYVLCKHAEIRP